MRRIAVLILAAGTLAAPAAAEETWTTYKDWTIAVDTVDTGEDVRVTCHIWTGSDGNPVVGTELSNGDVLPPDLYPQVTLTEHALRHQPTVLQDGDPVTFTFDTGETFSGSVNGGLDPDGYAIATTQLPMDDWLPVLQTMRKASTMAVTGPTGPIYTASLSGFTAAYGKMAEQCGFPTTGVID
ncbi:hypothetical protein [Amorphus orientalis]|uniref:Uncharacterized protein n=1 Tax=Amorphus orientalis TaxID=649198 RepID=A0AAE3VND3_9HYPH|nr:hypothetical protein [Amorphus orientalis]MDQ0315142.1 hypothetical protein [Amorphus orientalis]